MATRWFVSLNGQEKGPLSSEELKGLVGAGHVTPTDFVRRATTETWVQAGKIKGLFPATQAAPPPSPAREPEPVLVPVAKQPERQSAAKQGSSWKTFFFAALMLVPVFNGLRACSRSGGSKPNTVVATQTIPKVVAQPQLPEEKPNEDDQIRLIVLAAVNVALKNHLDDQITPEEFNSLVQTAAKELGADKFDNTRHLSTIQPSQREERTLNSGNKAIFVRYGRRSAQTLISFFLAKTGHMSLYVARVGDKTYSRIEGIREVK